MLLGLAAIGLVLTGTLGGCAEPEQRGGGGRRREASAVDEPVTVDVAIARSGSDGDSRKYTGTTQPGRRVSAKARVEGQVLQMTVDAGDVVAAGQVLARIDDRLLQADLDEARAEYGARLAEVEAARFALAETKARLAEVKVTLNRSRADAERFEALAADGAVPQQRAEIERAAQATAQQTVIATEEQIRSRQRAIATAQQRADAQRAIVDRVRERLSYATVTSPLAGIVLDRAVESGDVVGTGDALLELGDFSEIQVRIEVADRDRAQVAPGQPVTVELDAFPGRQFKGQVARIFPIADPVARLIPVEIILTDPQRMIGGGLLARVSLASRFPSSGVTIPRSALQDGDGGQPVVFVVNGDAPETAAIARPVVLANPEQRSASAASSEGEQVEILSGLAPGDAYIVRSAKPLQDGQPVRRSFLSSYR